MTKKEAIKLIEAAKRRFKKYDFSGTIADDDFDEKVRLAEYVDEFLVDRRVRLNQDRNKEAYIYSDLFTVVDHAFIVWLVKEHLSDEEILALMPKGEWRRYGGFHRLAPQGASCRKEE
jgi:hypothetical protein